MKLLQTVRTPIIGIGYTIAPTLSTRRFSLLITEPLLQRVSYDRGSISSILIETTPIVQIGDILKFAMSTNSENKIPFKVHSIEHYKDTLYWIYTCEHSIWLYIGPWLCTYYGDTFNNSHLNAYVIGVYTSCPELGMMYDANNPNLIIVYRFYLLTKDFEQTVCALNGFKWIDNYHIAVPYPVLKLEALQIFIDGLFTKLSERDKQDLLSYINGTSGRLLITEIINNSNELRMKLEKTLGIPIGNELHSKFEISQFILTVDKLNIEGNSGIKDINFREVFLDA